MEVRQLRVDEAPALHDAIVESLEELRPWMPWAADEPRPVEDRVELLARWAAEWEPGGIRNFGIVDGDLVLGGCGFPRRVGDGLEIGYWVRTSRTGQGVATWAASWLAKLAFAEGMPFVEVHHDAANVRSSRVPAKLGFELVRKVDDEPTAPGEIGLSWEWRLARPAARPGAARTSG